MKLKNFIKLLFSVGDEYSNGVKHKVINILFLKLKFRVMCPKMHNIDFLNSDKCLVIAPHPDDESIGLGGLLLKYPKNFEVVVLSDGRYGGLLKNGVISAEETIKQRKYELNNAMNYIGISNFKNLFIEDKKVKDHLRKLKKLNLNNYDYVFVPNSNEAHIDHKFILDKVKTILKWQVKTKILAYEIWTPLIKPDIYFNISDVLDRKKILLNIYESQVRSIDYVNKITGLNQYRGTSREIGYAECFTEVKTLMQKIIKR